MNLKFYYRFHRRTLLALVPKIKNQVYTLKFHLLNRFKVCPVTEFCDNG